MANSLKLIIKNLALIPFVFLVVNCEKETEQKEAVIEVPTAITVVGNVFQTSARVNGQITSQTDQIKKYGICLNKDGNPDMDDAYKWKTNNISKVTEFSMLLSHLEPGTKYYVKVFAENEAGIAYGQELSFTTNSAQIPKVETSSVKHIMQHRATCQLTILSDSGSAISNMGICWGLTQLPTLYDSVYNLTNINNNAEIVLNHLSIDTRYYVRAFASNSIGTAYGNEISFSTLPESGQIVTDAEGNEYSTLVLGEQTWFNQNLKSTKFRDGSDISNITIDSEWSSTTEPAYCWYNNDESHKDDYGALYNYYVVQQNEVCPSGWHIPSQADFQLMANYLEGKSSTLLGAGFFDIESGWRYSSGKFENNGSEWWTTSVTNNEEYIYMTNFDNYGAFYYFDNFHSGKSIRCIKDLP